MRMTAAALNLFDHRGGRRASVERGVLLPRRGEPVGPDGSRQRAANYPAEESSTNRTE